MSVNLYQICQLLRREFDTYVTNHVISYPPPQMGGDDKAPVEVKYLNDLTWLTTNKCLGLLSKIKERNALFNFLTNDPNYVVTRFNLVIHLTTFLKLHLGSEKYKELVSNLFFALKPEADITKTIENTRSLVGQFNYLDIDPTKEILEDNSWVVTVILLQLANIGINIATITNTYLENTPYGKGRRGK